MVYKIKTYTIFSSYFWFIFSCDTPYNLLDDKKKFVVYFWSIFVRDHNATENNLALRKFQSDFGLVSDQSLVLDGEFLHMRYSSHLLNFIMRDGMAENRSKCGWYP